MTSQPPRPDNEATREHRHVLLAERFKNLDRQCGFAESTKEDYQRDKELKPKTFKPLNFK